MGRGSFVQLRRAGPMGPGRGWAQQQRPEPLTRSEKGQRAPRAAKCPGTSQHVPGLKRRHKEMEQSSAPKLKAQDVSSLGAISGKLVLPALSLNPSSPLSVCPSACPARGAAG